MSSLPSSCTRRTRCSPAERACVAVNSRIGFPPGRRAAYPGNGLGAGSGSVVSPAVLGWVAELLLTLKLYIKSARLSCASGDAEMLHEW